MSYSSEQLDRWATWLETETSYSITKFPTAEQLRYFGVGVSRGDFSWMSSAVGYVNRAVLRSEGGVPYPGAELRVVQELGKAAHNHAFCAAVGRLAATGGNSLITTFYDVEEELRAVLAAEEIAPVALEAESVTAQLRAFDVLQTVQDSGSAEEFDDRIRTMSLPVHAAFIDAAEAHGWPQPGLSSTADAVLWTPRH